MENNFYLCLAENNYLKFDAVNSITNVFFDDYRQQIFIVKSASICVKSARENSFNFQLDNFNNIIAIKFSEGNNTLAVQRNENSLELITFKNNQIVPNTSIHYELKKTIIYGFIWTEANELIVISSENVEIFQVNPAKKSMKSLKALPASSNWFCYNRSNFLLLSSNNGNLLTPILIKQGSLTKLMPIQMEEGSVSERDVTTGMIYDKPAILILRTSTNRTLEISVYLLEGPVFKKNHILKLGFTGRVAISIIDSLIIIHHQTNKVSLIFDIALDGDHDPQKIMTHSSVVAGKSIKPFSIKLPSVSLKESTMNFELYSVNWVIFHDIIIDVKNGFLFKLELLIDKVLIGDKIKLVEFLMHRSNAKSHLIDVLAKTISPGDDDSNEIHLSILEIIFDKLNKVYKLKIDHELNKMQALPSPSVSFKTFSTPPVNHQVEAPKQIVIEQNDMLQIFNGITDKSMLEKVLTVYIYSLVKNSITCEIDLSKLLVLTLVGSGKINDLQQVLSFQVLHESKMLACFLLSLANYDPLISQMAMDMLKRLNAHEIIVEILLEQGKVIDALRLTRLYNNPDAISARKYLDAALKGNKMTFFSVYNFFISRNQRLRGNGEFLRSKELFFIYSKFYSNFFCR
jgi:hypothetical protein